MSKYCGNCGSYLSPEDVYCGNCGTKRIDKKSSNDENYKKVLYSYYGITIALLSKLAKVDGRVCEKEAHYIKTIIVNFKINPFKNKSVDRYDSHINNLEETLKDIVRKEKENTNNINDLCDNLSNLNVSKEQKIELINKLITLAHMDKSYSIEEENFIIKILNLLHLDYSQYKDILKQFTKEDKKNHKQNNNENKKKSTFNGNLSVKEAYEILELNENAESSEVKKQYRLLAKKYHYD